MDVEALIERVLPILRTNPGRLLMPVDLMAAGLNLDEAKTVCVALHHRPDLATVSLEVLFVGQPTGQVIGLDFKANPQDIAPDVKTWHDPRLRFAYRVVPSPVAFNKRVLERTVGVQMENVSSPSFESTSAPDAGRLRLLVRPVGEDGWFVVGNADSVLASDLNSVLACVDGEDCLEFETRWLTDAQVESMGEFDGW